MVVMDSAHRPTSSRAELRRAQVIEAARECFRASGFHGASMAEIAAVSGMSVGHIYRYFASKEAIITAIVEQGVAEKINHIAALEEAARANGQDLAAASAQVPPRGVAADELERPALTLEIMAEAARNPTIAEIVRRSDAVLTARAAQMIATARPHYSAARVRAVVCLITALYEGWMVRTVADPEALNADAEQLRADLVAHALRP